MEEEQFHFAYLREKFPVKLYAILQLADVQGPGCFGCSWLPDGRAFKIYDEREFMRASVPMFFTHTKIRSFHRQLHLWGFKRLPKSVDSGAWYNEYFDRGAPEEMKKMVRKKIKGEAKQEHPSSREEVEFESMMPSPSASKTPGIFPQTIPLPIASKTPGLLLRNIVDPTRIPMDLKSVSARLVPVKQVPFNCSQTTSHGDLDLSPPTTTLTRYVSSDDCTTPSLKREERCPIMNAVWPSGVDHQAASPAIISGIGEAKFRLIAGLEPLPWKDEPTFPTNDAVKTRMASRIEPLPIGEDTPPDEFASYIDKTIKKLL